MLAVALFVLIFGFAFAAFSGGNWESAALGGLFGVLVGAMNHQRPLVDWLYPDEDKAEQPDDGR